MKRKEKEVDGRRFEDREEIEKGGNTLRETRKEEDEE